ncbi:MAG: hypothetical protein EA412_03395 [Chitinophagaceae bacterium]|nr:MAG: hypothetical protein EA412_03395 [Chitinophagaceae bacterium]
MHFNKTTFIRHTSTQNLTFNLNISFTNMLRSSLLLCFIVLLLVSCSNERIEGSFTKEELAWLVYDKGDTVDFYSKESGEIQFIVTEKTELHQVSNKFPIEAEVLLESDHHNLKFKIYLLKDQYSFKRYVRLNHIYRPLDLLKPVETKKIEGLNFFNVYEIEESSKEETFIQSASFNKQNGFLEFTDSTGVNYIQKNLSESNSPSAYYVLFEK